MKAMSTLLVIGTIALALAAQAADNAAQKVEPATNKAWKVAPNAADGSVKTGNGNFKMSGDGSVRPSSIGATKVNEGALLPAHPGNGGAAKANEGALLPAKPGNSGATKVNEGALLPAVRSPNAATKATKVDKTAVKQ